MDRFLIVAIDGTTARFFTLEPAEFPEYESGPNLIEREQLSNLSKGLHGRDLWANTKTGRNRGSAGQAHTYDDRRQKHVVEFERHFARAIATKIAELIQAYTTQQLLLIAEPKVLGIVREALSSTLPKTIGIAELAKDVCHLKPHEIHEYLANKDLLPVCKKAGISI